MKKGASFRNIRIFISFILFRLFMKFKIDNKILEKFPGLNIGVIVVKGIDNTGSCEIMDEIAVREKEIRENFNTGMLSENPKIADWRKAYSSFGAKPKKYKCSVENLYRMILNDISLKHINKLVDIYNYISIKHMVPIGGDDLDKIDGNIALKIANGDEDFVELGSTDSGHPKEGEVVYCDDNEVLCRRWNWRECDKSKMTEETKNVTLVIEAMPAVSVDELGSIMGELKDLVVKYCGGETKTYVLNEKNSEIEF